MGEPGQTHGPTVPRTTGPIPTWVPVGDTPTSPGGAVHAVLEAPARAGARCAVLLVQPVGREQVVSLPAMVALSHELAMRGALVMRMALRGTGDSTAAPEALSEAWVADVRAGLWDLHRRAPMLPIHAVGLRLGAAALGAATAPTPAAQAFSPQPAESPADLGDSGQGSTACRLGRVVLWEPVGGRAYLRKAAALRRMSLARDVVASDRGTETSGELYSPAQSTSLRGLKDPSTLEPAHGWQIERETDPDAAALLYDVSSEFARVPRRSVQSIALTLTGSHQLQASALDLKPVISHTTQHAGRAVTETLVQAGSGRPGILVTPGARQDSHRPSSPAAPTAVHMVSAAAEPMDGPTGLWTEMGRELAAHGMTVLRSDRPGCGVLSDPLQDEPPIPYESAAVTAVREDAQWLAERTGLPVTGVGLCVGSWLLMRAGGGLERVIAFNNIAWRAGTRHYQRVYTQIASWDGAPAGLVPEDDDGGGLAQHIGRRIHRGLARTKNTLEARAPAWLWHLVGRTGLVDAPSSVLLDPALPPTVELIMGKEDLARFEQLHGHWVVNRLHRKASRPRLYPRTRPGDVVDPGAPGVCVEHKRALDEILLTGSGREPAPLRAKRVTVRSVPELDHGLLSATARGQVRTILLELLAESGPEQGQEQKQRRPWGRPGSAAEATRHTPGTED